MHKLLARQLRRCFGSADAIPESLQPLIDLVDRTYGEFDNERAMIERSMLLASEELYQRNAKLHTEHNALEKTLAALREQTLTTESLYHIAQATTSELDLHTLMQRVIALATTAVNADFGMLVCDAATAQMGCEPIVAASNERAEQAATFFSHFQSCGGAAHLPRTGGVLINDAKAETEIPLEAALCAAARAAQIQGVLVTPLRGRNGAVTGTMFFGREAADAFSPRDKRLIEGIASHASVAIENASLFRATQEANERLAQQALYDALTGLPSRPLFRQRMEEALARTRNDPQLRFGLMFVDLDRFKAVNDSHGHEIGDRLLKATAERLLKCGQATGLIRPDQVTTISRLGGDEFTILIENVTDTESLRCVAEQLIVDLRTPFYIAGNELEVSASIGIAFGTEASGNIDEVLRNADAAMYYAKGSGKSCVTIYDAHVHDSVQARMRTERELTEAVRNRDFFLQYQPICSLSTRRIVGFEALIRWTRDGKVVGPNEFISIAEQSQLIVDIGKWVIEDVCRQYSVWRSSMEARPEITISLNLSRRQLIDPDLVSHIAGCLHKYDVPPSRLKFEITESMVMQDMDTSLNALGELRELGVGLQMDDFGTGHSSLAHLTTLPLDGLKIDRVFIRNLAMRRDCMAVLQAIITLAHNMKISVVAEGVEEPDQVALLQALDCDYAQGYYFARPLDPSAALRYLHADLGSIGIQSRAA